MTADGLVLHGYWRSTASYRLRIALNLKGLAYRQVAYDLRRGEQSSEAYRAINPQGLVPALEAEGLILTQSPAILEWLEERYPEPALLPPAINERALVRAMAALICCDIHPLNNLRVLTTLKQQFGAEEDQVSRWIVHWIENGFTALEQMIERHRGAYAFGDSPTLADCCLVPQAYSAERFGVSLDAYPCIKACVEHCRTLDPFIRAHPSLQSDAD